MRKVALMVTSNDQAVMTIEVVKDYKRFSDFLKLQKLAWGGGTDFVVPEHVFYIVSNRGGQVLGAYIDNSQLVGFSLAFLSVDPSNQELYLSSHMVAVHPDYQSKSVGFEIKQAQRKEALKVGIKRMEWTYDPMLTKNANLNLRKLGAKVYSFKPNHYGEIDNALYRGLPTDRFQVTWDLTLSTTDEFPKVVTNLVQGVGDTPVLVQDALNSRASHLTLPVPLDYTELKSKDIELAKSWQNIMRTASAALLGHGYYIGNFRVNNESGLGEYLFVRI